MELDNSLNTLDGEGIATNDSNCEGEALMDAPVAEPEILPDPLEAAQEAAKQLDEATTLLKNVVNTLSSLEKE